jgi:hypothetical protein
VVVADPIVALAIGVAALRVSRQAWRGENAAAASRPGARKDPRRGAGAVREWVMASVSGHAQRREDAYRRAADAHRRAEALEAGAAEWFTALGDVVAASRHRCNVVRQGELADADDARAAACAGAAT